MNKLKKLRLNRIDLVDRGANPGAEVVLFKRDEPIGEDRVSDTTYTAEDMAAVQKQLDEATQKLQDAEAKLAEAGEVSKRVDDLAKRLEEREAEVKDLRESNEMRDAIAKAAKLEPLFGPAAEFAGILSKIHKTLNEDERKVWQEKVDGAVELVKQSAHFEEVGVSGGGDAGGDTYSRIEKAAQQKFPNEPKANAVTKFLATPEGRELYKAYRAEQEK